MAGADIGVQLLGVVSVGAFATSWLTWLALEKTMGVRVSPRVEEIGQDVAELGIDAYPEFVRSTKNSCGRCAVRPCSPRAGGLMSQTTVCDTC